MWTRQEMDEIFSKCVFGFIFSDIQREIALARLNIGGGNLLAALGLLCYTEFMGGIQRGVFASREAKNNFNAFFDSMGAAYATLNANGTIYDIFRCGMVHEYAVKRSCDIIMLKTSDACGIGQYPDGRYYFVVEKYFEDFSAACRRLYSTLMSVTGAL